jgi:hypothetical protein
LTPTARREPIPANQRPFKQPTYNKKLSMGTDIYGVFQRLDKATGTWHDIQSNYEQTRNYQLFAVLAGVRNGVGFAGVHTGDHVTPISEPRGLPSDFAVTGDGDLHPLAAPLKHIYSYDDDGDLSMFIGDDSHSWLTGLEMLEWYKCAPTVTKAGIVERTVYETWNGNGRPSGFCSGVFGPNVMLINDTHEEKELSPKWTHIRCQWQSDLGVELAHFFTEVAWLVFAHEEIRFVFGFDS